MNRTRLAPTLVVASMMALSIAMPARAADVPKPSDKSHATAPSSEQQALLNQAQLTIKRFSDDPAVDWVKQQVGTVKGVMIVPEQIKGAFMIGGAGGKGVVLVRHPDGSWSYPAFYSMGSVSFGFQAGGEVSEIVLLAMTDKGLDAFRNTTAKLGADVSVAAGPVGAGAKAATTDILAFSRQNGLYGGASLEGSMITADDSWNVAYYAKTVTPSDILFGSKVFAAGADPLRNAVVTVVGAKAITESRNPSH